MYKYEYIKNKLYYLYDVLNNFSIFWNTLNFKNIFLIINMDENMINVTYIYRSRTALFI